MDCVPEILLELSACLGTLRQLAEHNMPFLQYVTGISSAMPPGVMSGVSGALALAVVAGTAGVLPLLISGQDEEEAVRLSLFRAYTRTLSDSQAVWREQQGWCRY